jgi:subtilisin family serine protease
MESQRYVVLRRVSASATHGLDEAVVAGGGDETIVLSAENVPVSSIADLERDPQTIAAAPEMPIELIEPVAAGDGEEAGEAWGVGVVGATASAYDGSGVAVAILDTGIEAGHPAFDGVPLRQEDFTGEGDGDGHGHGTHCAGTILGRDVGVRIGVARGVTEVFVGKVLKANGRGTAEMAYRGMAWAADRGANIISMSLTFAPMALAEKLRKEGWPPGPAISTALESYRKNLRLFDSYMEGLRARRALGREVLVIAATGNDSLRDEDPRFRVAALLPAAAEDVVSVAALGRSGGGLTVADFSNTLPTVSAPGVAVKSAWKGGGLRTISGTSMACPHVAGVAALWWQSYGATATAELVRSQLVTGSTMTGLAPGQHRTDVGYGLVRAP